MRIPIVPFGERKVGCKVRAKIKARVWFSSCVFTLAAFVALPARAQQALPTSARLPMPHRPQSAEQRVWTNEDIVDVRKPWDIYSDQKLTVTNVADPPTATGREDEPAASPAPVEEQMPLPQSVEEAYQDIVQKYAELHAQEELIHLTGEEYLTAPEDQRIELKRKIDRLTADAEATRAAFRAIPVICAAWQRFESDVLGNKEFGDDSETLNRAGSRHAARVGRRANTVCTTICVLRIQ